MFCSFRNLTDYKMITNYVPEMLTFGPRLMFRSSPHLYANAKTGVTLKPQSCSLDNFERICLTIISGLIFVRYSNNPFFNMRACSRKYLSAFTLHNYVTRKGLDIQVAAHTPIEKPFYIGVTPCVWTPDTLLPYDKIGRISASSIWKIMVDGRDPRAIRLYVIPKMAFLAGVRR